MPSVPGQVVDGPVAAQAVTEHWLDPTPVALPIAEAPVTVTPAAHPAGARQVARPAVAGPRDRRRRRRRTRRSPRSAITTFLTFRPDGQGGLDARRRRARPRSRAVEPQLGTTEAEPRDATLAFGGHDGDRRAGRRRPRDRLAADLRRDRRGARAVRTTGPPRRSSPRRPRRPAPSRPSPPPATGRAINAVYTTTQPEVTTESLQALGPAELIGEFTTRGFTPDSGQNIRRDRRDRQRRRSSQPNSVFSLNGLTSPRNEAQRLRRRPGSSTTAPRAAASAAASRSSRRRSSTPATSPGSTTSSTRSTATTSAATRRAVRRPSSRARSTCGSATTGPPRCTSAPSGPRRRSRCSSTASSASR